MADRTSAELFGILFDVLAQNPDEGNKALAKQFFELSDKYDFSKGQLCANEALITLGLAERRINSEGDEQIRYFGEPHFKQA